jgi:hypothetical protein
MDRFLCWWTTHFRAHLWHYWSWNDSRSHERASEEFSERYTDDCYVYIMVRDIYVPYVGDKNLKTLLEYNSDLYVVAPDWSWTYVRTHEEGIGPYFARLILS